MPHRKNVNLVLAYLKAVESCDAVEVEKFLSPAVVQIELPNALKPKGGERHLPDLLDGLSMARKILQSQRYDVIRTCAEQDYVALEAKWTGTLAVPIGRLQPGDDMICHSAMFFKIENGLIALQRNFDCFEHFA